VSAGLAGFRRHSRPYLLDAAPEDGLTWAPPGLCNHVLWHGGHALWLADHFAIEPLAGQSELPEGWGDLFAAGAAPTAITDWPGREAVVEALHDQHLRVMELLSAAEQGDLAPSLPRGGWHRFAGSLLHGLHDEARHQGEMYSLVKQMRKAGAQSVDKKHSRSPLRER